MDWPLAPAKGWLFGASDRRIVRWLFLRALAAIYFSAFYSLLFQIRGLIGSDGILPANDYLAAVAGSFGHSRYWFAPTLLWLSSGGRMLMAICWIGVAAAVLLLFNFWPRGMLAVCLLCFLSFVTAAGDFSAYQSDGMLLEAGFISLFFAPRGFHPRMGTSPPSRASLFLLQWEWFRIYFESGVAKIASGDHAWRHLTAMDEYYQNGPLPTWIGWYVQHLPHWFHASTTLGTLILELVLVWMLFLPRRHRILCFLIVSPWEIGIILTANYTFLNYLVLSLGILLVDDPFLVRFLRQQWEIRLLRGEEAKRIEQPITDATELPPAHFESRFRRRLQTVGLALSGLLLGCIFYVTTTELIWMLWPRAPLPSAPVVALQPFRIANQYGLFAVMTRGRYEIEFQGSQDGENWVAYPFRYKPQDVNKPPGIFAPYQPRFDWNLWFASLGSWRQNPIVTSTEERLLANSEDVLALFVRNPFPHNSPHLVRAVLWQYWFTGMAEKRATGLWWRRKLLGLYAPTLALEPGGRIRVVEWPPPLAPHE